MEESDMNESTWEIEIEQTVDTYKKINEIIDKEIESRLRSLGAEVELLSISDDGSVNLLIKKASPCIFDIRREVLEKIVVSRIKLSIPEVQKITVKW